MAEDEKGKEESVDRSEVEGEERPDKAPHEEAKEKVQEVAQKAQAVQHMVQSAQSGLQALISLIINPITWIVILIIALVLAGFSTMQVIGQNENACFVQTDPESGDVENGSGGGTTSAEMQKVANQIGTFLMKHKFGFLGNKPMTKEQAAAVVGNAVQESSLNPKSVNSKSKAAGLFQWLPEYSFLPKTAAEMNKPWTDVGVQLTYLTRTLNTTEKDAFKIYGQPEARDFLDSSNKDVAKLANAWAWGYERMGKDEANIKARVDGANDFMKYFKEVPDSEMPKMGDFWDDKYTSGGAGGAVGGGDTGSGSDSSGGGPAACGGDVDNSSIVQLAIGMAWPKDQRDKSLVTTMADGGESKATPMYDSAKKKAEAEGGKDPMNLWADCGRFAATVIKNTVDKEFPWGPTSDQYTYMEQHTDLWKKIGHDKKQAQPGDIIIKGGEGGSGHIAIYVGQHDGIDATADASMGQRTGLIGYFSIYDDNMFGNGARQFDLFRYVGPNSGNIAGTAADGSTPGGGKVTYGSNKWPTSVPKVTGTYQGRDVEQAVKDAMKHTNAALPKSALCTAGEATLRCDAAKKFNEWNEEYKKSHGGANIPVNTSYRDMAWQEQLYRTQPKLTAPPGTSNHGWGLAVDIQVGAMYSPIHNWLVKTAPKYGWQWPASVRPGGYGPDEAWHFEFGTVS